MKIVFFGTPEFAVASLSALVEGGYDVAAVVTMPDKASGRGMHTTFSAVKQYAVEHSLPVLQPASLKDPAFVDELRAICADLFIVIAFRMLPEVVWTMPPMGTFNLHGSLLPRYRGAAPINRAIMNGDTVTGVTTFMLRHEIDTGDILAQRSIEVGPDENVGSVYDRLMAIGAELTVKTVEDLAAGRLTPVPQDSLADVEPCPAPKIFKEDCRIDWQKSAAQVHNHVRGLSPCPGAWSGITYAGRDGESETTVKILATKPAGDAPALEPGQLALASKRAFCGTAAGAVELLRVQPANKKAMAGADWLRGLRPGENGRNPWLV